MPKSTSKKKKKDSESKEDTPGPDRVLLFRVYLKQCERVGIAINETIKKTLCQDENPTGTSQLLLGPEDDSAPLIGAGGCRALFSAILGNADDQNTRYTAFEEIRIWRSNISDQGAKAISHLLKNSNGRDFNVKYLELSDNHIGALGALSLGRSLCCGMNSTLLTLNLDFNTTLRSDGVCSLAKGLKLNSTLKRLSLRFCGIRENGGTPISDIISFQRSSIESIDLEGNHLGGTGVKNLCPGLKSNTSLLQISLADIGLSSSDCGALESFGESICKHKTLTELNFMRNIIGKPGALALSKHLEHNKKIISIKVDTTLCPESYEALCRIPACEKKKRKKKSKKKKK